MFFRRFLSSAKDTASVKAESLVFAYRHCCSFKSPEMIHYWYGHLEMVFYKSPEEKLQVIRFLWIQISQRSMVERVRIRSAVEPS